MTKYVVEFVGEIPKGWIPKEVYVTVATAVPYTITWEIAKEYDFPLEILPEGWWIAKDSSNCSSIYVYEDQPTFEGGQWSCNYFEADLLPEWIAENLDPEWLKLKPEDSLYQQHKKGKE